MGSLEILGSLKVPYRALTEPLGRTDVSILSGKTSLGRLERQALLVVVSVKIGIIDFLQTRIKKKLADDDVSRMVWSRPTWLRWSRPRSEDHIWRLTFLEAGR